MLSNATLVTAPAIEPVELDEAKANSRIIIADDDALVLRLIAAARRTVEAETKRALISQVWSLDLERFPDKGEDIVLPRPPFLAAGTLEYLDEDGGSQSLANGVGYNAVVAHGFGRLRPILPAIWPRSVTDGRMGVSVTWTAGYGEDPEDVPEPLREAILLIVGEWYENREESQPVAMTRIPSGASRIISTFVSGSVY